MYQNLLVPLDGSPRTESILPLWDLVLQFHSKVIFLLVVDTTLQSVNPSLYENSIPMDAIQDYLKNYKQKIEEIISYLTELKIFFKKRI